MRFSVSPHFQSLKAIENGGASVRRGNSELIRASLIKLTSRSTLIVQYPAFAIGTILVLDIEAFESMNIAQCQHVSGETAAIAPVRIDDDYIDIDT